VELQYSAGTGVTLSGTLVMPVHAAGQRVPGVIILAGSGSADRDGNNRHVTTDLYRQIAALLAQEGIASLRYDKRGVGRSTPAPVPADPQHPTPSEQASFQDFVDWQNFVADAVATEAELLAQPDIDPRHVGIIGHSEGGIIAAELAGMKVALAQQPSAVVLVGAPGRPYDIVVRDQLARQLELLQTAPTVTQAALSRVDTLVADLRQGGANQSTLLQDLQSDPAIPAQFSMTVTGLYSIGFQKFWTAALQISPALDIMQYAGPVLVLQGGSDTQVSALLDAPALNQALSARSSGTQQLSIIPNASHFLKSVQDANTDPGFAGEIVPDAAAALRAWIKAKI
jgi:alpha-beta hydrolase superfamily lysophospholipase